MFKKLLFILFLFVALSAKSQGDDNQRKVIYDWLQVLNPATPPALPFYLGGSGRYMYYLCANNYTVGTPTQQYVSIMDVSLNDVIIDTINLTPLKNFSSIFYRAVDSTVHVVGNGWVDIIDAGEGRGTLNTKIASRVWTTGSASYVIGSYLPYPLDYWTVGGSSAQILGGSNVPTFTSPDGRYTGLSIRIGGHSNTSNMIYYNSSQIINANKIMINVINQASAKYPNVTYSFKANEQNLWYQDLQSINFPVYKFSNFYVPLTDANAYVMYLDVASPILHTLSTLGVGANRSFQAYCPNAPRLLFVTSQITSNIISVIEMDSVSKTLIDRGDINRVAYKDVNESGANAMIYNPYSGRMYVQANNNVNVTGVSMVHVYDPTLAVASMYVRTVTVGEFKSDTRVSTTALNTVCMNRTPIYEYLNIGM